MATTPTNKPIPSEDPRDLKFNAGKIDEVVTSDAHYYTDRFGVRRWTIAGFQYTAEEAIRNYGYITMDSFEDGATLTLPNQVLRYEATGEYYRFDGELPKTVSAGSTPETSGGIGLGAWVSVGDASLRTELKGSNGASMVGNGNDVLSNFLPHTPGEFTGTDAERITESVNSSNLDGKRTWIYGDNSPSSQVTIPDNVVIQNDGVITSTLVGTGTGASTDFIFTLGNKTKLIGGDVNNTGLTGVATVRSKTNVLIDGVTSSGDVGSATPFAYAYDFRNSSNITVRNCSLDSYTGAFSMIACEKVLFDGINMSDMYYHQTVDAGGYGFVFGACNDVKIVNSSFKAKDGDNGRHAVYLATQGGSGNTNTVISNNIFDWRNKSDEFRGAAINVRNSVRTLISSNIFDGTTISGILDTGTITNCDIINNSIFSWIYDGQSTHYGITLGDTVGDHIVNGGIVSNNSVIITRKTETATGIVYGINLSGRNRQCIGNRILVPDNSYPIRVPAGADNIIIANNEDLGSTGVQAFILFDGACSNITVKGNRTRRPMFRNVTNVTDLTVDFPRTAQVVLNSGVPTLTDPHSLIQSVTADATNIYVQFNTHVTQAAVDAAIADRTLNFNPPAFPVIADRTAKLLTIRMFGVNTTQTPINPSTTSCSVKIILNS
nr:MAG TPA: tail spike [Caudoviricetes sp.]